MPEMVASHSSLRFSALLSFQTQVDPACPSHALKASSKGGREGFGHRTWSNSLRALLTKDPNAHSAPPASASKARGEDLAMAPPTRGTLTRSQGHFSPHNFIRNALKRAFARDDPLLAMNVKRARVEGELCCTAEPMVCG